jgi:ubiquinone/menaquinone biosynthesis C-methylase UbiE
MRRFLRQSTVGREPLAVTMSGVRMGERVLQIGVDDPLILGALAGKTGLTGRATVVVLDEAGAERARAGAAETGALVDVHVASLQALPCGDGACDVVVIHARGGLLASLAVAVRAETLRECRRVLRSGGRAIVLEAGAPSGLRALLTGGATRRVSPDTVGGTLAALETAGFKAVRVLGEGQGYRFVEGLKA